MIKFSKTFFEPLVNKTFILHKKDGQTIELQLAGITSRPLSGLYESFTLNFDPPPGETVLPDDSYLLESEGFGPAFIFISATHAGTPDPRRYYYESVFNILIEENP